MPDDLPPIKLDIKITEIEAPSRRWVTEAGTPIRWPHDFLPNGKCRLGTIFYQRLDTDEILSREQFDQLTTVTEIQ